METDTYVYLVFCSNFPDTYLVGIFSTKEKAEDFKHRKQQESDSNYYHFYVDSAKIDEEYNEYR